MYVMTHIMHFVKSFSLVIVLGILMYEKFYLSIYLSVIKVESDSEKNSGISKSINGRSRNGDKRQR